MVTRDSKTDVKKNSKIKEIKGKLSASKVGKKLMKSVVENDKETIEKGRLIRDSINQNISSFNPSLMFEQMVANYAVAKAIYGESILRKLSGYNPNYLKKNIGIPEFQRELKKDIQENIETLKEEGLLEDDYSISEKGVSLASLILYVEELDNIVPKGILGEKVHKKTFIYGEKEDSRKYKKDDRYRDIDIRKSVKLAIRRSHKELKQEDLKVFERQSKGQICIIYGLDASGSMKGNKLDVCKKAGVALAYKAISEKDKVGLLVFGSEIKDAIAPTDDFNQLLQSITRIKASKQTNIAKTIEKAIELFPNKEITKHLILLTDALPTSGSEPEKETLEAASIARTNKITISMIGINLNKRGKDLAEEIVRLGSGRLYVIKDLKDLDKIVLEDYYSVL